MIMAIPKIIHYCWFGKGEKSEKILRCMESWQKYLPDYEILEWNEQNCDIEGSKFASSAYKAQKWAFAADYFRFKVLYEHGGIYLDTDMLLHRSLNEFLRYDAFFPMEDYFNVNAVIVGAVAGCKVIERILSQYENTEYKKDGGTVCDRVTPALRDGYGFEFSGQTQFLRENIAVYAPNVMIVNVDDGQNFCEHLYDAQPSWWDWRNPMGETYKYTVLKRYFYNQLGRPADAGGGRSESALEHDAKEMIARYGAKRVIKRIIREEIYSRTPRWALRLYKKIVKKMDKT